MERQPEIASASKREFVHAIRKELAGDSGVVVSHGAVDCLLAYDLAVGVSDPPISLMDFLSAQFGQIQVRYGEHTQKVMSLSVSLHEVLSDREREPSSIAEKIMIPARRAQNTLGMWKDLGHIKKDSANTGVVDSIIGVLHEDPEAGKNILESLVARLTVGEFATKPLIGVVAVAALAHGLPEWVSTDVGIQSLLVTTAALAVLKTEQDINSKLNGKPFLTVETNILSTILGFELRKSAYFIRLAWLVPMLAGPVLAYIRSGADISSILITQDLLYLGPMVADVLLRLDLMDGVVDAVKSSMKKIKNITGKERSQSPRQS